MVVKFDFDWPGYVCCSVAFVRSFLPLVFHYHATFRLFVTNEVVGYLQVVVVFVPVMGAEE